MIGNYFRHSGFLIADKANLSEINKFVMKFEKACTKRLVS